LDVKDGTGSVVLVLFDAAGETLLMRPVSNLISEVVEYICLLSLGNVYIICLKQIPPPI
jgi:hypothetical protein